MDENTTLINITIDEDLRTLTIPTNGTVFGVVGDISVNRVMFVLPRYFRGFDLTQCVARVNYCNPNGDANYYEADDLADTEGKATFTWLMAPDVTSYIGDVKFSIQLYKKDEANKIVKNFNTKYATGKVLEGYNVEQSVTPEQQETLVEKISKEVKVSISESLKTETSEAISAEIEKKKTDALTEMNDKKTSALTEIENKKTAAVKEVNSEQVVQDVSQLKEDINTIEPIVYSLEADLLQDCEPTNKFIQTNITPVYKYDNKRAKYNEGKKVSINQADTNICYKFPVIPGHNYSITGLSFNDTWTSLCVFSDSENNSLSEVYDPTTSIWLHNPVTVTAPEGSTFVYVNGSNELNTVKKNIIPTVFENKTVQISKEFKYRDLIDRLKKNNLIVTMRDIKDSKISQLKTRGTTILSFGELPPGDYFEPTIDIINIAKQMLKPSLLTPNDYGSHFSRFKADINISTKNDGQYGLWYYMDREHTRNVGFIAIGYTTTDGNTSKEKIITDFGNPGGMFYAPLSNIPLGKIIKHINLSVYFNSNMISPIYIDSIVENRKLNPFIIFTTDNGGRNFYDVMKPMADKYGLKITTSTPPKDMTESEVKNTILDGHEFAIYGLGSVLNSKPDFDDFVSDDNNFLTIKNSMQSMIENNFINGVTYPCAYFCRHNLITKPLKKACNELGIYCLRGEVGQATLGKIGNFEDSIPTIGLIDTNLDAVKKYIDDAIKYGVGISIFTHSIVSQADPTALNTLDTIFEDFCKYVKQKIDNGDIESINIKQLIDRFDNTGISKVDVQRIIHA